MEHEEYVKLLILSFALVNRLSLLEDCVEEANIKTIELHKLFEGKPDDLVTVFLEHRKTYEEHHLELLSDIQKTRLLVSEKYNHLSVISRYILNVCSADEVYDQYFHVASSLNQFIIAVQEYIGYLSRRELGDFLHNKDETLKLINKRANLFYESSAELRNSLAGEGNFHVNLTKEISIYKKH